MLFLNNNKVEFTQFPNKEKRLDLKEEFLKPIGEKNKVIWKFESNSDIFELFLFDNSFGSFFIEYDVFYDLYIPYMPYSRMDRVEKDGTAHSLFVLIDLISSKLYSLDNVFVLDPHSPATVDLSEDTYTKVKRIKEFNYSLAKNVFKDNSVDLENSFVVFPDKGAAKRYNIDDYPNVITLKKTREFSTGKIQSIEIGDIKNTNNIPKNSNLYFIDDLCSYGGTFIKGLESMRQQEFTGDASLIVTHSEEALLLGDVLKHFKHIFTTNSILEVEDKPQITQYNFLEIFNKENN